MSESVKIIDPEHPPKVEYCIPTWLRDEQIKLATARCKERVQPRPPHDEPIALVGYGPSLNDTWEQVKSFPSIMTCSGAHKFMVERGVIPTWHLDVDPRPHKVQLLGPPCKDTEYLIASTCHPALFDHLDGYRVKLWHIYDATDEAIRQLPPNEWALMGGCSVGVRMFSMARFLGFRQFHVFGMDGNEGPSGKHAAAHPAQPKGHALVTVKGREFKTTKIGRAHV